MTGKKVAIKLIDNFNPDNPPGTKVVYWPLRDERGGLIFEGGKRTATRGKAFIDQARRSVIFLDGISGYVALNHVTAGESHLEHIYNQEFNHRW